MNEQNRADLRDKSKAELEALKAEVQAALDAKAVVARFEAEVRATTTAPIEARIALLEGAMGEALENANLALPVLRDVLKAARLGKGANVAIEMLAQSERALAAIKQDPAGAGDKV